MSIDSTHELDDELSALYFVGVCPGSGRHIGGSSERRAGMAGAPAVGSVLRAAARDQLFSVRAKARQAASQHLASTTVYTGVGAFVRGRMALHKPPGKRG